MAEHVNSISSRLSLRAPQRESLEILARIAELIPLSKERDPAKDLEAIASEYPSVEGFERDFPSLCFALATGVGKTRLMGAFISYLRLSKGIKHFFVLAPNLTIYNKLIADFTPGTPKYVFQGISEFAMIPPEIITGDNYESGRGVRDMLDNAEGIHINIFNISKINSEVRGGNAPRIKRLSEYIGESYFDYLAGLKDLVLLMDESHRYRASAGVNAINELNPVLGLELTATPQVESNRGAVRFQNIIYDYPLHKAMEDGYVKEPAVATRSNFNAGNYRGERLERLKLEDGITIHETVKANLKAYADNHDQPYVKPFMLVIARDTSHAESIMEFIKSDEFSEGRYKDRVITVHSGQRGEEKDENVERLLSVENPEEPTEIVIHVNMLKEGWDVTNLYTIVPLRAANAQTLVEQSIGRGLRLPYGKRTGDASVDRLTIVAHDNFDAIIAEAKRNRSITITEIKIDRDDDYQPKKLLEIKPNLDSIVPGDSLFRKEEKEAAVEALEAIKEFERLPNSRKLQEEAVRREMAKRIEKRIKPKEAELEDLIEKPNLEEVIAKVTRIYAENTIDIPCIVSTPKTSENYTFAKFTLDTSNIGQWHPVDREILIQRLRTAERERMQGGEAYFRERRPEDYIVSALVDFNDISYDDHADLLYDLAGQMVSYLRSYLNEEEDIHNALQYHRSALANVIHAQMQDHYEGGYTEHETTIVRGFERPKTISVSYSAQEEARNFRDPVEERLMIRGMLFQGFAKCIYPMQKFHSDTERKFAVLLEDDEDALKWFKPGRQDLKIRYAADRTYEPDFVVETDKCKLLCEPKMKKDIKTEEVQAKAGAARKWCETASEHELKHGGKPWKYLLIPHDVIRSNANLKGLISCGRKQGE